MLATSHKISHNDVECNNCRRPLYLSHSTSLRRSGRRLQERFRLDSEPYDFIFCRNLLIYFDPPAQYRALRSLRRLLNADGLLFGGLVESTLLAQHGFASLKWPMAFAFQKKERVAFQASPKHQQRKVWSPAKSQRNGGDRKPPPAIPRRSAPETEKYKWVPDLNFAERLADRGRLGEAAEICEASLRQEGPSARAFHLLGLIRDGAGDQNRADDCYRKALYLEPDHYGALIHLALLKDKGGESKAAKVLKDRARRVQERMK